MRVIIQMEGAGLKKGEREEGWERRGMREERDGERRGMGRHLTYFIFLSDR